MAQTRLTADNRCRIAHRIVALTFEERTKELLTEEHVLFHLCADDLYGKGTLAKIAKLPEHWFRLRNYIHVAAGGMGARFDIPEFVRLPFNTPDGETRVKDAELIIRIQTNLHKRQKTQESKDTLRRTLDGLLKTCTTLERFYLAMPEAEEMVGELLGKPSPKTTALVVTGKQVMCMIAKVKGEEREGCCDGSVIAA